MKTLLILAAVLFSSSTIAAVDLSGTGIPSPTNTGYHFTAKIAVKNVVTGKIEVVKDATSCASLAEEYKQAIKLVNTKAGNTDVKVKTSCAANKTGKPIGWKITVPAGVFNS
jgi:hypothetical protein